MEHCADARYLFGHCVACCAVAVAGSKFAATVDHGFCCCGALAQLMMSHQQTIGTPSIMRPCIPFINQSRGTPDASLAFSGCSFLCRCTHDTHMLGFISPLKSESDWSAAKFCDVALFVTPKNRWGAAQGAPCASQNNTADKYRESFCVCHDCEREK